jgi:Coenzyme PQQ synthesis protein D (PqqD)
MTRESSHLHAVVDQDGAAILDIERSQISILNGTGAFVWRGFERGESVETIIANLAQETGGDLQLVARDVRTFVEDLKRRQLLPD